MHCLDNIDDTRFYPEQIRDMMKLYEYKGKDFYYQELLTKSIKSTINETIEKDIHALIKIMDLNISDTRKRTILKNGSEPKTKDECILANLKHVFDKLHERNEYFELTSNQILNLLNSAIFNTVKKVEFNKDAYDERTGLLVEKKFRSRRDSLDELFGKYIKRAKTKRHDVISLISAFYVDFRNMETLAEENELVGLFMIYILAYRENFHLFKYSSFFEIYLRHKDEFEKTYYLASKHWDKGNADISLMTQMISSILIEGYEEIDGKIRAYDIESENSKFNIIMQTINRLPQTFTRKDIMDRNPGVSKSTVDRVLKCMSQENSIRAVGEGRNASWMKLTNENANAFQMDIFGFIDDLKYQN